MDLTRRATPCIGICSTTYGDLVCRGCKRFAHEIVGWNAFSADQRERVWRRLAELRDGCIAEYLDVRDAELLRSRVAVAQVAVWEHTSDLGLAYELLRRAKAPEPTPESIGLARGVRARGMSTAAIRDRVEAEFLRRSIAVYERSFKIPIHA